MGFGVQEPPATTLSHRHRHGPWLLLLEAMQPPWVPLLLATIRPPWQHLLPPDALVSGAPCPGDPVGCVLTRGDTWDTRPLHPKPHPVLNLNLPPRSYTSPRLCWEFEAGTRTTYRLNHRRIYVLTNVTAWVEARWGGYVHRTPNITLYLNEARKCPRGWAMCQHRHR